MVASSPRVVVALAGAVNRTGDAAVKYGGLLAALSRHFQLAGVIDATLSGPARWLHAIRSYHPERARWRERFHKNVPAFVARSHQVARAIQRSAGPPDVVLQVGGLFDATQARVPVIIYTDYTARLSAHRPEAGRAPLTGRDREEWFRVEGAAYHRAAHVATRSTAVGASLMDDYGLPAARITAVGGGVNFPELPAPVDRTASGSPRALFIGKDFFRKGGDRLLRAFDEARRRVPDARLTLVTHGPIDPGLALAGVDVMAPTWDRAAVAAWYREADVFVLPSRLETWGDVLLEAMAFGLPCVGVAGQAMAEIIGHGETGYLVAEEDTAALSSALVDLLSDAALRRRFGAAGRQRVEQHFTWDRVVERLAPHMVAAAGTVSNRLNEESTPCISIS